MIRIMSTEREIPDIIQKSINDLKGVLDKEAIIEIEEYLSYREWGLAFETLCVILNDEKIVINLEPYQHLKKIGEYMEIKSIFMQYLQDSYRRGQ